MLTVSQSHSLETLFHQLALFLGRKQDNPLQPLTILIPSLALGRWLNYQWAHGFGISANLQTAFPADFMWQCFSHIVPDTPKSPLLSPEVMHWRLFHALAQLPHEPCYDVLQRYLARTAPSALGRWQLAGRIAQVFGYYRIYRRDWLAQWREGQYVNQELRHQDWQAALWRHLFAEEHHQQGQLLAQFYHTLKNHPQCVKRLPARVAIFTTVRLPPNELEFFRVLSTFIDIHFYHFNPSMEYWADTVDEKWLAKMRIRYPKRMSLYDKGHPLLLTWGKQQRDTFRLLSELSGGEQENDWLDFFDDDAVEPSTLLQRLQYSILHLQHEDQQTWPLLAEDNSIKIHRCHSLTRQLEVLHDNLLTLFAQDPNLQPHDVVVMLPDIASASGAIEAVFGTVSKDRHIPWQLTGVASVAENSLWRAFNGVYELSQQRFSKSNFMDWLSLPPVLTHYGLVAEDIERCHDLLERAAIYRYLDGEHRAQHSLDSKDTDTVHSFLFGLERLLLAITLPSDFQGDYAGIRPVLGLSSDDFRLVGILARAVSDIAERRYLWQQVVAPLTGLQQLKTDLLRFFVAQVGTRAWENLHKALDDLIETLTIARMTDPIPLYLLLNDLSQRVAAAAPGAVPGGVVHFSRLGALRLIPYKVICILGLEDTAFPRREVINEFDLLRQDKMPRAGDRSRRDDDKSMFLEALMSAKQHILLFYNAFSHHETKVFPPSSLISQLVDYLSRRVVGGKSAIEQHCIVTHRLQPFSPSYFKPEQPQQTYASEWLAAAQAVLNLSDKNTCFVDGELAQPHELLLELEQLSRFYQHPAKYFLSQVLKVYIAELKEQLGDEEPLTLNQLAQWQLRQQLVLSETPLLAQLRAQGQLPVGVIGEVYCQQSLEELTALKHALAQRNRQDTAEQKQLACGEYQLLVKLPPLTAPYQVVYTVSKQSPKHVFKLWLYHLAWQLAGAAKPSYGLFLDTVYKLQPLSIPEAATYLQQLIHYFQQGQQRPLLFDLKLGYDFCQKVNAAKKTVDELLLLAHKDWAATVEADVFWRQVTNANQTQAVDDAFQGLALCVWQGFFNHQQEMTWTRLNEELMAAGALT
ncbi:exodeoxyribonuclease V subunit gamma [Agitococcus lubricus]|uniref:RecBCD enzyme subunit RecC n=1 Tax=Agitococcus lubricus TaxID=1077255 RepID=A0A2T5J2X1_9GAMM|nr:exodeoxyribonuclease V subunit gamma [Agitococcus lubricus]PTQ90964.1 DNA helicase/exodeoxyribonuclease V gamma subunit [Agitococcus lubricus]